MIKTIWLVVTGTWLFICLFHIWDVILPIDYFSRCLKPPTKIPLNIFFGMKMNIHVAVLCFDVQPLSETTLR
jgi:hypothetical protein